MTVQIHKLKEGRQYTLCALGDGKTVETVDFMDEMSARRAKEFKKLMALIDRSLEHGPPKNRQKCNSLGNGIWEFKTTGGLRLVWFWDEGRMIVCTHGFKKARQKTPPGEITRALARKSDYFEAKASGLLEREGWNESE
jgi:phage-related protein